MHEFDDAQSAVLTGKLFHTFPTVTKNGRHTME